jgi:hypothetical protein
MDPTYSYDAIAEDAEAAEREEWVEILPEGGEAAAYFLRTEVYESLDQAWLNIKSRRSWAQTVESVMRSRNSEVNGAQSLLFKSAMHHSLLVLPLHFLVLRLYAIASPSL